MKQFSDINSERLEGEVHFMPFALTKPPSSLKLAVLHQRKRYIGDELTYLGGSRCHHEKIVEIAT